MEESLSLQDKEKELIRKALTKHRNRRKAAAQELGSVSAHALPQDQGVRPELRADVHRIMVHPRPADAHKAMLVLALAWCSRPAG